ncbi:MAG: site-2 protease family protein [Gemmatimonadetes bacterium]|nr:site-2 protease family protein [Gemmatimonadota bacterium]
MNGFRLARILGFEIRVDFSWFIIFALVLWSLASAVFPARAPGLSQPIYLIMGVVGSALFFASLLAHELSHSIVARRKGIEVEGITLFIFGGVARTKAEAKSPGDEFLIAGVGPVASVVIGMALYGLGLLADRGGAGLEVVAVLEYIGLLNIVLAVFNLLPGFPLDGGRLFRSLVWKLTGNLRRATRVATTLGRWLGYALVALGILQAFNGIVVSGLWLVLIGWFLRNAAAASYQQQVVSDLLSGVRAEQTMSPDPVTVDPQLTLDRLFDDHFLRSRFVAFPVVDAGLPIGMITLHQVRTVPREQWGQVAVRDVMAPLSDAISVQPAESMTIVMDRLRSSPVRRLLVLHDGRLVGIISAHDVTHWLAKARQMEEMG